MPTKYKIVRYPFAGMDRRQIHWVVYQGSSFMKSFDLKREAIDWVIRQEARDAGKETN